MQLKVHTLLIDAYTESSRYYLEIEIDEIILRTKVPLGYHNMSESYLFLLEYTLPLERGLG